MENDLISRAALMGVPNVRKVCEYDETGCSITYKAVPVEVIEKAPAVEAEPVRRGRWIEEKNAWIRERKCSACGNRDNPITAIAGRYCWYCGAKMDGGAEG